MMSKNYFPGNMLSILLFLTILLFSQCKKDGAEEPSNLSNEVKSNLSESVKSKLLASTGITSSSYYLVNSLPSGYVTDGSRDYTTYIQAAVTKYSNIVFPNFPILINDNGIKIGSNKIITFLEGSELRMKSSSKSAFDVFAIRAASNVVLYNPVIKGDRYSHAGTSGEWGMGIAIYGSSNVSIYNAKIRECWGDGIYIADNDGVPSRNIEVIGAIVKSNRRIGITITSVDGLKLDNIYAGFSDGTAPKAGINFEPNSSQDQINNILLNNIKTERNSGAGIQIGYDRLYGGSSKISNITINNHTDFGSERSLYATNYESGGVSGKLEVNNLFYQKNTFRPMIVNLAAEQGLKFLINNPKLIDLSGVLYEGEAAKTYLTSKYYINPLTNYVISTAILVPTITDVISPIITSQPVVFAVNAGGSSFTATNGITYQGDKSYSGGSIYKTTSSTSNTPDDVLYQSERYGNFSYSIPVTNGTYEITYRFAEILHEAAGKRRFDVISEGSELTSNLDIFATIGENAAYDVTKTVTVSDGTLNIQFRTDIDNAKLSALHVIKK